MTCTRMLLVCLLLFSCYLNCEGKDTVQFLMSDAKQPNFNLEAFRTERNEEEDSIASESIILPTLNLESHPFAVIVLPNIGKGASSETRQVKSLDTDEDNNTQNHLGLEKTVNELKELTEGINIYSLRKNKGEIIKLTVPEKGWEPNSDIESNGASVVDKTSFENTTDVDYNVINVEEVNSGQNNSVYSSPPILKKAPLQESNQDDLKEYLPKDLSFSSKIPLNSEVRSRETTADGFSQTYKRNIINNEVKNSFLQIQTLPIVDQFSRFQNFSLLETHDRNSASPNKFSKNREIETKELRSSNDHHSVGIQSEEEELSEEDDRWAEIFVVPVGLLENVREGNQRLRETSNLNGDKTKISESTNEFPSSEDDSTKKEHIDLVSQSSNPINPLLVKIVDLSNSSTSGSDLPTSAFEIMSGVSLPASYFETPPQNDRIADTFEFFDTTRPIPLENEQVTKLVELRNQLSSLKTTTLLPKTLEKEKLTHLNQQKDIELLKVHDVEHKNLRGQEKVGKSLNNSIAGLDLLSPVETNPNLETTNAPHNETFHTNPKSTQLTNSGETDDLLNWSNFVKTKIKPDEENAKRSTTNEEKIYPNFSTLESVITPIRPHFIETVALNENPNKTFDVVMEPFNISDAIPQRDQTRPANLHENPSENVSNFHFHPLNENQQFLFPDINIFQISPNMKTYRGKPVLIRDLLPSNLFGSNEIHNSVPKILPTHVVRVSESVEEKENNPFEIGCPGNEVGCSDVTKASSVRSSEKDSVTQSGGVTHDVNEAKRGTNNLETFVDAGNSNEQAPIVTETVTVTRTNLDPDAIVIINGGSDTSRVSVTPLSSLVPGELAGSSTPITTSNMLQNNIPLDTVTKEVTVTVNTPSAVFYTKIETIHQTEFVTVTKTVPSQNLRTSKLLHHHSTASSVAIKPSTVTVTKTVDALTTITQTLYSTVCDAINEDYPDDEYFTQLNNYGLNAKKLVKNRFYTQLRGNARRQYLQKSVPSIPYFDELYWPKEPETSKDSVSHLFLDDQYTPDIETFAQSYYPHSDSIPQGNSDTMSVTIPDPELGDRKARQINFSPHSQLYYGIPFYGSKALNRKFLKIDPNI